MHVCLSLPHAGTCCHSIRLHSTRLHSTQHSALPTYLTVSYLTLPQNSLGWPARGMPVTQPRWESANRCSVFTSYAAAQSRNINRSTPHTQHTTHNLETHTDTRPPLLIQISIDTERVTVATPKTRVMTIRPDAGKRCLRHHH